jgi:hypothetical protein
MKLTPARKEALADALEYGKVFRRPKGGPYVAAAHDAQVLATLAADGLLHTINQEGGNQPYYVLSSQGRDAALQLTDSRASASRQHYIDTGQWLTYGDRPEFAQPKEADVLLDLTIQLTAAELDQFIGDLGILRGQLAEVAETVARQLEEQRPGLPVPTAPQAVVRTEHGVWTLADPSSSLRWFVATNSGTYNWHETPTERILEIIHPGREG